MARTKSSQKAKPVEESKAGWVTDSEEFNNNNDSEEFNNNNEPGYEDDEQEASKPYRPRKNSNSTVSSTVSSTASSTVSSKKRSGGGAVRSGSGRYQLPPNYDPKKTVNLPSRGKAIETHWGMKVKNLGSKVSVLSGKKQYTFGGSTQNMLKKIERKSPSAKGTYRVVHHNRHEVGKFNAEKSFEVILDRAEVQRRLREITNYFDNVRRTPEVAAAAADGSVTADGGLSNEEAKLNSKLYNFYSMLDALNDTQLASELEEHNEKVEENKKKWLDARDRNKDNFRNGKDARGKPTLREQHKSDDKKSPQNFSAKRSRENSTHAGQGQQGRKCLMGGNNLFDCRHVTCQNQHDLTNEPKRCTPYVVVENKDRRKLSPNSIRRRP